MRELFNVKTCRWQKVATHNFQILAPVVTWAWLLTVGYVTQKCCHEMEHSHWLNFIRFRLLIGQHWHYHFLWRLQKVTDWVRQSQSKNYSSYFRSQLLQRNKVTFYQAHNRVLFSNGHDLMIKLLNWHLAYLSARESLQICQGRLQNFMVNFRFDTLQI